MKKLFKFLVTAFIATATLTLSSCEYFEDMLEDAFEGEADQWLEITVKYDDGKLNCGNVNLAFFYTETEKVGHTENNTRLLKGKKIEKGLTVVCYGNFGILGVPGVTENAYYIKNIPIESSAKAKWGLIFNLSPQLRELEKEGRVITGGDSISGEKYGKWSVYHPEDNTALLDGQERVPAPLSNKDNNLYFTNDIWADETHTNYGYKPVNWDNALGKIGLSTRTFD